MINFGSLQGLVNQFPWIAVVLGAVIWVLGWKIYRGFVLFAGALVGALMLPDIFWAVDPTLRVILAIVGGVIGGVFALFLLPMAMFLIGLYIGTGLATTWLGPGAPLVNWFIGVLIGVAFFVLHMFLIVLVTSLSGSWLVVKSLIALGFVTIGAVEIELAVILFTIAGIALQYRLWGAPKVEARDIVPWRRQKE